MPDSIAPTSPRDNPPVPLVPAYDNGSAAIRSGRRAASRAPLPDAKAIRLLAVPDTAPPYDDCAPARRAGSGARRTPGARQQATPATGHLATDDRRDQPRPTTDHEDARLVRPAEVHPWPGRFAQVLAETLAGSRPAEQLVPWTTEQARQRIVQLGAMLATGDRPRVRRVLVTCPAQDVLEMAVLVDLGGRIRALAVRLERARRTRHATSLRADYPASADGPSRHAADDPSDAVRWFCTAIEAA